MEKIESAARFFPLQIFPRQYFIFMLKLRDMLRGDLPVGRKLDFLIQEINRECNTIGSKCSDLTIARDVVDLKAEVEKIREQVQNIE